MDEVEGHTTQKEYLEGTIISVVTSTQLVKMVPEPDQNRTETNKTLFSLLCRLNDFNQ